MRLARDAGGEGSGRTARRMEDMVKYGYELGEPSQKWLLDIDPHLNDIHQRVHKIDLHRLISGGQRIAAV